MIEIYRMTRRCIARNLWVYLGITAIFLLLNSIAGPRSTFRFDGSFASDWLWLAFTFNVHRFFLTEEPLFLIGKTTIRWPGKRGQIGFNVAYISGMITAFVLAVVLTKIIVRGDPGSMVSASQVRILNAQMTTLPIALLLLVLCGLLLFGTLLPAAADRKGFRPIAALGRTSQTILPIMMGLMTGPVAAALGYAIWLKAFKRALTFIWPSSFDVPETVQVALSALTTFVLLCVATLTVATLCRAYRKVAPQVEPTTPST